LVVTHGDLVREAADKWKLLRRLQNVAGSFRDIVLISTNEALVSVQEKREGLAKVAFDASGANALERALEKLIQSVREHRAKAAIAVTGRIARRALSCLE
jgi:hypothetical protein